MSYPFASIGTFLFEDAERPVEGTDSGWNLAPSYATSRPLGSATDSIVTMAIGSARRAFRLIISPSRFADMRALMNTSQEFTDWERPIPDSRQALVSSVVEQGRLDVLCPDGVSRRFVLAQVELISQ